MKRKAIPPAKAKSTPSYDGEVLSLLAQEFSSTPRAETEQKIRRRLRDKKLGDYDAARVELLRRFKDTVQAEVHRFTESPYFVSTGNPLVDYAEMDDFDRKRMTDDYAASFPAITRELVAQFVDFFVFLYHVR